MKKNTIIIAIAAVLVLAVGIGLAVFFSSNNAETPAGPTEPAGPTGPVVIKPDVADGTMGADQWKVFEDAIKANANITIEELSNTLSESTSELFFGMAMPLEVGTEYFTGFDNYQITGYKAAAVYMPMIGSIPFVGYVFELEDGTNATTFISNLTDNCNPRWNICVTAEQTVAGAIDNFVFFLMCPENMSVEGGDDMGDDLYDDDLA